MLTKRVKHYEQLLSRRSVMLGSIHLLLAAGLTGRLFYLQVREGGRYSLLAERNQFDFQLVPPSRGRIYDVRGRLLAGNAEAYVLSITPSYSTDLAASLYQLSNIIKLEAQTQTVLLEIAASQPNFIPLTIRDDLSQREVARLAIRTPDLPGVAFDKVERRIYPQGLLTSHLIGYVGRVSEEDILEGRVVQEMANFYNGKSGVEFSTESYLRGIPGQTRVLVNAFGRPIRRLLANPPIPGRDVRLTVDINVQSVAANTLRQGQNTAVSTKTPQALIALAYNKELGHANPPGHDSHVFQNSKGAIVLPESGSVVVLDVATGAVKAMVSSPSFDPNRLARTISLDEWRQLINHSRDPLLDRAVKGQYAPGSTIKMIVALAALEAGLIKPESQFECKGHLELGDARFHCWEEDGHGKINLIEAIEQSCDVFFYELSLKVGIARIAEMAKRFGLGTPTNINIPGEAAGIVPDKKWKLRTIGERWTPGETVVASIGQGYLLATPLQLAMMVARLANGKQAVSPYLLADGSDMVVNPPPPLGLAEDSLAIIRRGMELVVAGDKGTARFSRLPMRGVEMAGKTGTVQTRRISIDEREEGIADNIDRPWRLRDHALFVGYAPADKPKYAIAVVVEHGGNGSRVAAPIARNVLAYMLREGI